jgi:hypothetical protein
MSLYERESTSSGLLVFVLAAFYWTKSLLCNVAAFTGMLLYPEEGPDGKFSSFGRMMLWTVGRQDGVSRRLVGCCSTDECPDGIPRSPDGCKGSDYTVLKSTENLLETYL